MKAGVREALPSPATLSTATSPPITPAPAAADGQAESGVRRTFGWCRPPLNERWKTFISWAADMPIPESATSNTIHACAPCALRLTRQVIRPRS